MPASQHLKHHLTVHRQFLVGFISLLVGAHGLFILATTLLDQLSVRRGSRITAIVIDIPLLVGLSLMYLGTLLRRRKRTAWLVTVVAYGFYLGLEVATLINSAGVHGLPTLDIIRRLLLPLAIVGVLLIFQKDFMVRSDIQGFRWAARFSVSMLLVALVYGVAGFQLLDKSNFHQEISVPSAIHYTIDQFDLTTSHPLHPYTKRAHLFVDSLSFVSIAAVAYAVISLFQPLRLRLGDQGSGRKKMAALLEQYGAPSEEFFKLWPHDKQYFFDESGQAGIAFHVSRGVALCLSDPVGEPSYFGHLLDGFQHLCFGNDWQPSLIHVEDRHRKLYESRGFSLQKLGQEAVVNIENFQANVVNNKYFRHIRNKFTKQDFSCELLQPPHHAAVLERLRTLSDEWLQADGRVERGFVMGYFSLEYIQQCPVMVVRDAAGTIQAFLNQVPAAFDTQEATFDMLRHATNSQGNINDFLLLNFIAELHAAGYQRLNLGFCPLVGLDTEDDERKSLIGGVLRFAYANGDRFYSFSGLHRFKAKYEPEWHDRYIAYQGGVRGFSRATTAVVGSMRVKAKA